VRLDGADHCRSSIGESGTIFVVACARPDTDSAGTAANKDAAFFTNFPDYLVAGPFTYLLLWMFPYMVRIPASCSAFDGGHLRGGFVWTCLPFESTYERLLMPLNIVFIPAWALASSAVQLSALDTPLVDDAAPAWSDTE